MSGNNIAAATPAAQLLFVLHLCARAVSLRVCHASCVWRMDASSAVACLHTKDCTCCCAQLLMPSPRACIACWRRMPAHPRRSAAGASGLGAVGLAPTAITTYLSVPAAQVRSRNLVTSVTCKQRTQAWRCHLDVVAKLSNISSIRPSCGCIAAAAIDLRQC